MRPFLPLVVLLAAAPTAAAATIRAYDVRVQVGPTGAADVEAVIRVEDARGTLRVPAGFAGVTDLALVDGPDGTTVAAEPSAKQTLLRIVLAPSAPASATLTLRFRTGTVVAEGAAAGAPRLLRHALLNSQPDTIEAYTARVILPPGSRVHAIREVLPAARPADPLPRITPAKGDRADEVVLRAAQVMQGDTVSMRLELAARARSPFWMIAGLSLSVLYLVRFRDLVTSHPDVERRVS